MKARLTSVEKSATITLAESIVSKENVFALFVYGPKVAGYPEDDSDYRIIIVVKDAHETTHPGHDGSGRSSPIVVGEKVLKQESEAPPADGSVVSKLLNVYEPLVNAEFLRNCEVQYKKWVIAGELLELQSDYGNFSSNFTIPPEYFLFKKLHEEALLHPEVISGLARTYSSARRDQNVQGAIGAFREAADLLAEDGVIESTQGTVRLFRGKKRRQALSKLFGIYPLKPRAARSFAVHELLQRAGFESKTKPLSQLKMGEETELPKELDHPKELLRLEQGVVFDDPEEMVEQIARLSGFAGTYAYQEKKKGDLINSSKELEIWTEKKRAKFILKTFSQVKSAKWLLLDVWSLAAKRFNMSPLSRLDREVDAATRVRQLGIKTHKIVGVSLQDRTLVTEYVAGSPLIETVQSILEGKSSEVKNIEGYAEVLAKLHKAGLVYGDTKPQNVLVGKEGIELLDLEQTVERGGKGWDLAEFLYFSASHLEKKKDNKSSDKEIRKEKNDGMKIIAEAFLGAYKKQNGTQVISDARSVRYLLPFLPVISLTMLREIRSALKKYS